VLEQASLSLVGCKRTNKKVCSKVTILASRLKYTYIMPFK